MMDQDHDLLITIVNDTKWIKEWAINHERDDAAMHATVKQAVNKAHDRVDKTNEKFNWLLLSGVLAIIFFALSMWFKR